MGGAGLLVSFSHFKNIFESFKIEKNAINIYKIKIFNIFNCCILYYISRSPIYCIIGVDVLSMLSHYLGHNSNPIILFRELQLQNYHHIIYSNKF